MVDKYHSARNHQFAHSDKQQVVEHKIYILRFGKQARCFKQRTELKAGVMIGLLAGGRTQNYFFLLIWMELMASCVRYSTSSISSRIKYTPTPPRFFSFIF